MKGVLTGASELKNVGKAIIVLGDKIIRVGRRVQSHIHSMMPKILENKILNGTKCP